MPSYVDVFDRKEQKYLVGSSSLGAVLEAAKDRLVPDEHGQTVVRSLYYDTPDWELIERSLDKPLYKEKLRLRVYGEPSDESVAFVEIKKKFKGIVYKRRVAMSLAAAEAYLSGTPYEEACASFPLEGVDCTSPKAMQISREIDFFIKQHGPLSPSILTECRRQAFVDPTGDGLRITVDSNLKAAKRRRGKHSVQADGSRDLGVRTPATQSLVDEDEAVVEIKNAGPMPLWLSQTLGEAHAYTCSFSKCGTAYMKERDNA